MRQRSRRQGRAYAAIPNAAMRDERISIEARGLLALLMTYSDDWTFVVDHLQQVAGCGRDKMRGMLKELEAAGYVIRHVLRGAGGHLAGTEWMIVDDPAAAAHGVVPDEEPQDAGEQGKNGSVHRPPENPSIGATDPLKNRPPVEPTAGKPVPIRRTTDKNTKSKKEEMEEEGARAAAVVDASTSGASLVSLIADALGFNDPGGSGWPKYWVSADATLIASRWITDLGLTEAEVIQVAVANMRAHGGPANGPMTLIRHMQAFAAAKAAPPLTPIHSRSRPTGHGITINPEDFV